VALQAEEVLELAEHALDELPFARRPPGGERLSQATILVSQNFGDASSAALRHTFVRVGSPYLIVGVQAKGL
jgi:hypothetical protein